MNATPSWYAVYTKPRWEKRVAAVLTQKGLENYCPMCKVQNQGSERKKLVEVPLFPSHVFVFTTPTKLTGIRKTAGIINLVYWLDQPAIMRGEEITGIKNFLAEHKEISLEKTRINRIERVQILQNPLQKEVTMPAMYHQTDRVLLPTLGYALVAQREKSSLEHIGKIEDHHTVQSNGAPSRA